MTLYALGRVFGLALFLYVGSAFAAAAHALPGSLLIFQQSDQELTLSISLAIEDLILAAPELAYLEGLPTEMALSDDDLVPLSAYFDAHISLNAAAEPIDLSIANAALESAENEHVGVFKLLNIEMSLSGVDNQKSFPLSLTYDAVMHEVRNHRATVYWSIDAAPPVGLADFGFRTIGGAPQPVVLPAP